MRRRSLLGLALALTLLCTTAMQCGGAPNTPPQAVAGGDLRATVGETVSLDGSASADADGDTLTYHWSFASLPAGSGANLAGRDRALATFVPDLPGSYAVDLTVSDGVATAGDSVTVEAVAAADNRAPVADAGPDRTIDLGEAVTLDAGASTDPDGDALTYAWVLTSAPVASAATLSDGTGRTTRLVPDTAGTYVVSLTVSDGVAGDGTQVSVLARDPSAVPRAPTADAGPDEVVDAGDTVSARRQRLERRQR